MSGFLHHSTENPLPGSARGGVVAIGNFDGVHRGHQAVLQVARETAQNKGVPCHALSFEPHPRTLFRPDSPVFRLTPERMKARVMEAFGLDGLLVMPFTRDLAGTSAEDFVADHMLGDAAASHVISGYDFHFGKNRAGTPDFLKEAGERLGFGVTIVEAQIGEASEPFSSSAIRRQLGAGKVNQAAIALGYRWTVSGPIVEGAQLGRTLGYPTANMVLEPNCRLQFGIYAVRLRRADGSLHDGVASYGRRPTFDNGAALFETFVFDFDGDLYGEMVEVSLFEHIRGEEKFDSAEALVARMDRDAEEARRILREAEPLSILDRRLCFDGLTR